MIKDKIKVIFWDLDNTLWNGILAEGDETTVYSDRKSMIDQLNHRGIVNSICSKNEYKKAKERLIELKLWDLFVFPQIAFQPKGEMICKALNDMNLRAENALFIDDNEINLKEVEYYNPGISTINAVEINEKILENEYLQGKKDLELSRIKQYRVLEKKASAKKKAASNYEFLHSCHIKLRLTPYSDRDFERVFELSERTNQLNFTKNRMTKQELREMLDSNPEETTLCRVSDDFGDYGIVGFYSLHLGKLIHYVFSCRIMNMGIEQYIYRLIGCPELSVKGNTASDVGENTSTPDWIELIDPEDNTYNSCEETKKSMEDDENIRVKIYGIGACDLFHVMSYFDIPGQMLVYDCNYFKGDERSVNVGTEYIRSSIDMTDEEKLFCREHFYNYTGEDCFSGKMFTDKYDYVVMSFHDDMTLQIYRSKTNRNLRVVRTDDTRVAETNLICKGVFMPRKAQLRWLEENFYPGEYISEERFYENIIWIRNRLPSETKLILITSPELDFYRKRYPHIPEIHDQIIKLNRVIRKIGEEYPKSVGVVEINSIICSLNDITGYIFHYPANKSRELYNRIVDTMERFGYREPKTEDEKDDNRGCGKISFNPSGEDWGDDIDVGIRRQYHLSDNTIWLKKTWDDFRKCAENKQIIVFGAGVGLAYYLSQNEETMSLRIVDNDPDKKGTPVSLYLSLKGSDIEKLMMHPAIRNVFVEEASILRTLEKDRAVILITNLRSYDDIQAQIAEMGDWDVFSLMQMEARKRGALHDG